MDSLSAEAARTFSETSNFFCARSGRPRASADSLAIPTASWHFQSAFCHHLQGAERMSETPRATHDGLLGLIGAALDDLTTGNLDGALPGLDEAETERERELVGQLRE